MNDTIQFQIYDNVWQRIARCYTKKYGICYTRLYHKVVASYNLLFQSNNWFSSFWLYESNDHVTSHQKRQPSLSPIKQLMSHTPPQINLLNHLRRDVMTIDPKHAMEPIVKTLLNLRLSLNWTLCLPLCHNKLMSRVAASTYFLLKFKSNLVGENKNRRLS